MTAELAAVMEQERQEDEARRRPWPETMSEDEAERAALLLARFCCHSDCTSCRFNDGHPEHRRRAAYCRLAGFPYLWRRG